MFDTFVIDTHDVANPDLTLSFIFNEILSDVDGVEEVFEDDVPPSDQFPAHLLNDDGYLNQLGI